MKKTRVLGVALAVVLSCSPISKISNSDVSNVQTVGAAKHYYVYNCNTCDISFCDGAIGKALMRSHVARNHTSGWFTRKDVCTAMGQHTSACDKATNNVQYYWFK